MNARPVAPLIASQREAAMHWEPLLAASLQAEERQQRLAVLADVELPGPHTEAWKYTSLRALGQRSFGLSIADEARAYQLDPTLLEGLAGPRLVFVNGVFRPDLSLLVELPPGVSVQPLSRAGSTAPVISPVTDRSEPFDRLNAALAVEGALVRVTGGCRSPALRLLFVGAPASQDLACHMRLVLELEAGAELCLIEQHAAASAQAHLCTVSLEVALAEQAKLEYQLLQQAADTAALFRRSRFTLAQEASVSLHVLELGAGLARHVLEARLEGTAARFDSSGVFIVNGRRHVDTQLQVLHQAKDTVSHAWWRGVADDRGRGVFRGAISVAEGADGSDAILSNKNLLLSAQAEIDSKPELEIYADEVKAAHGATVGQLDSRSLFYLQSRGIPAVQARAMLIAAFCRELLQSIPDVPLRDFLDQRLVRHLPALA